MTSNFSMFLWDIFIRPFKNFFSFNWIKGTQKWLNSTKNMAGIFLFLTIFSLVIALMEKFGVKFLGVLSKFGDIRLTCLFLISYIVFSLLKHYQSGEYKGNWRKAHDITLNPGEALQKQSDKEKEEFLKNEEKLQEDV